jgi:hypothetical protein
MSSRAQIPSHRFRRTFLAAVLLLLSAAAAFAQCTSTSSDPYLDCAKQAYTALQADFQIRAGDSAHYWQFGNIADTMFDFLAMLSPSDFAKYNPIQSNALACPGQITLAQYLACLYPAQEQQQNGCWYDDYGWWGISSTKAFDPRYARIFDDAAGTKAMFQQIARTTWGIMSNGKSDAVHFGAAKVWDNRDNITKFTPPVPQPVPGQLTPPRFQGGVWQYDLFTNPRSNANNKVANWAGPLECSWQTMNPKNPMEGVGPYQDTVVNGLYFTLAQRLLAFDTAHRNDYEPAIRAQYGFLKTWMGYDQGFMLPTAPGSTCPAGCDNNKALLQLFPPPQRGGQTGSPALVYERMSTYAAPLGSTAPYPQVENWSPAIFWTGDQGLALGGLIDYARAHADDNMSPEIAPMLVKGVMTQLVGPDGGVLPWAPGGGAPGNDTGDYDSGDGIFMRYLLYANNTSFKGNPIPALVKQPEFQTFLQKAANAAYCNFNQDTYNPLFGHFNTLATMVAAKQLLTSTPASVTCPTTVH